MTDVNSMDEIFAYRNFLAFRFLRGEGIEIGALDAPTKVLDGVTKVRYLDCFSIEEMKVQYPELNLETVVQPDIIDDGELLSSLNDESVDFIVGNHFLEHTRNPIATIGVHYRKLRKNGILFYAIPDKRFSFDKDRPITSLSHLIRDYLHYESGADFSHYLEWEMFVNKTDEDKLVSRIQYLQDIDHRIHFHVFDIDSIIELIRFIKENLFPFEIEHIGRNNTEIVVVIRKSGLWTEATAKPDS